MLNASITEQAQMLERKAPRCKVHLGEACGKACLVWEPLTIEATIGTHTSIVHISALEAMNCHPHQLICPFESTVRVNVAK